MSNYSTDIVVIGAGPVGLFSVFEAGMLKMKCHVIDTLEFIGGQCTALYPEKPIYDIPAHPQILAEDLIKSLEKQAAPFEPTYHLGQRVEKLIKDAEGNFIVTTSKNNNIKAKAVIIAAGCGAFGPNKPPLENINEYEGKSLFYMVHRKEQFRDKKVVIAGGGDSAIDWAISLSDIAEKIYLIHRRAKFRCAPDSLSKIKNLEQTGKIELVVPYQLDQLQGEDGYLSEVILTDLDNNKKIIQADYLLAFFGLAMELGPIARWGLNLNKNHIEVDPATCATNISGVYAIGDIVTYPKKLKLILCGFAEAAMAAYDIYSIVYPGEALHFEYSTTKGVQA